MRQVWLFITLVLAMLFAVPVSAMCNSGGGVYLAAKHMSDPWNVYDNMNFLGAVGECYLDEQRRFGIDLGVYHVADDAGLSYSPDTVFTAQVKYRLFGGG